MDIQTTALQRDNYEGQPGAVTTAEAIRTTLLNRVSWSAVFAGIVMAFAAQLIMNLVGVSVGAGAAAMQGQASATGFSLSAAIWAGITGIIAAFIGGYTAGRLAGEPERTTAGWHGLISWGASVIVVAILVTTAAGALFAGPLGSMTSQMSNNIGASAGGAAGGAVDPGSLGIAAIVSAIALVLGAIAAWFGGCAGTVKVATLRNDGSTKVVH